MEITVCRNQVVYQYFDAKIRITSHNDGKNTSFWERG